MVRIQVKHGGQPIDDQRESLDLDFEFEFLYDCENTLLINDIALGIIQISNLHLKIRHLLLQFEPRLSSLYDQKNGNSPVVPFLRAMSEAKAYTSKEQVLYNKPLSYNGLKDHIRDIQKEFNSNYQLLDYDNSAQFQKFLADAKQLQVDSTKLFWAGKELQKDKKLCDYIGKNEKTKIVLRLLSTESSC